jgi:CRISPR type III-A-associated protein Csm2
MEMETILTSSNILNELKKKGSLMELLTPEQFAGRGQVAEEIAKQYVKEMKPTQLRKVFHALKEKERAFKGKNDKEELDSKSKATIRLFIPELAYAHGRKLIPKGFYDLMSLCFGKDKLQKIGDLRVLMQFLTSILAYHKFHEKVKEGGGE